jgi:hypothetical protein
MESRLRKKKNTEYLAGNNQESSAHHAITTNSQNSPNFHKKHDRTEEERRDLPRPASSDLRRGNRDQNRGGFTNSMYARTGWGDELDQEGGAPDQDGGAESWIDLDRLERCSARCADRVWESGSGLD